jgi:hypothetical protein
LDVKKNINNDQFLPLYGTNSVAEPVDWPLFAGAGAQVFRLGFGTGFVNLYINKILQKALAQKFEI